jgi:hypothetical protein
LSYGELVEQGSNLTTSHFRARDFAVVSSGAGTGTVTLNEPTCANLSETFVVEIPANCLPWIRVPRGPIVQSRGRSQHKWLVDRHKRFRIAGYLIGANGPSRAGYVDGVGNFSLTADQNQAGILSTVSYNGKSNGRLTLTSGTELSFCAFYLCGPEPRVHFESGFDLTKGQAFYNQPLHLKSSSFCLTRKRSRTRVAVARCGI